ncbi:MAG TPA: hypothetical protein VK176_00470 [Phycisphaerales bacterium]|nr:hypothetical protein [Phycisphaerales bacterium]
MRSPLYLLLCCTLLALTSSDASAQQLREANPRDNRLAYIRSVDLGWQNLVVHDRWNPVSVWVHGGDRGFTGFLRVSYDQDGTQLGSIIVPAAATPGIAVPIDFVAALPRSCAVIDLELVADNGRPVDRTRAVSFGSTGDEFSLGLDWFEYGQGPILSIGPTSLVRTPLAELTRIDPNTRETWNPSERQRTAPERWRDYRVVSVEPDRAPRTWAGFDGLTSVVIDSVTLGKLAARERQALSQWLLQGGHVVVIAASPGAEWRSLLPAESTYDLLTLPPPASVELSGTLIDRLRSNQVELGAKSTTESLDEPGPASADPAPEPAQAQPVAAEDPGSEPEPEPDPEPPSETHPQIDTAVEALEDSIESGGKKVDQPAKAPSIIVNTAKTVQARAISLTPLARRAGWQLRWELGTGAGLCAEGPAGLGTLTIVGVEPQRLFEVISRDAISSAWYEIFQSKVRPAIAPAAASIFQMGSGSSADETMAINAAMDTLVTGKAINLAALIPVWLCAGLLAILIGPVDALLLKKLQARQRSWATAIGWTLLVGVLAAYLPTILRSGRTTFDRYTVLDVRIPDDAALPPLAVASSINVILGGAVETVQLPELDPAAFVQGVSAVATNYSSRARVLPPLDTIWRTRTDGDLQAPTLVPHETRVGQWVLRGYMDRSPAVLAPIRASFARSDTPGSLTLTLTGLKPGSTLQYAALTLAQSNYSSAEPITADPSGTAAVSLVSTTNPPEFTGEELSGSHERQAALKMYAQSPACAVARVMLREPGLATPGGTAATQTTLLRIVLPVPADMQPSPESAAP